MMYLRDDINLLKQPLNSLVKSINLIYRVKIYYL